MENKFDCIKGLRQISQLVGDMPLKRDDHAGLSGALAQIEQELVRGQAAVGRVVELEGQIETEAASRKRTAALARKRARGAAAKA